jgi:hypothetical protein
MENNNETKANETEIKKQKYSEMDEKAQDAMIQSILGLAFCILIPFIGWIFGLIYGSRSLKASIALRTKVEKKAFSIAGIVISSCSIALSVVLCIFYILATVALILILIYREDFYAYVQTLFGEYYDFIEHLIYYK